MKFTQLIQVVEHPVPVGQARCLCCFNLSLLQNIHWNANLNVNWPRFQSNKTFVILFQNASQRLYPKIIHIHEDIFSLLREVDPFCIDHCHGNH